MTAFFGLLRIGNVTTPTGSGSTGLSILRKNVSFTDKGCILSVHKSKTNQYAQYVHDVTLPYVHNSIMCPTSALLSFLGISGKVHDTAPLFSMLETQGVVYLSQNKFRRRLSKVLTACNLSSDHYNTHSLRRGGATWLLSNGTSLAMVKTMGDWKSDAVYRYIKPTIDTKFDVFKAMCSYL